MRITHLRFFDVPYQEAGFYAKRATGLLDGRPFEARQYKDSYGLRGAEPIRWRVWWVPMPPGQKSALAKALHAHEKAKSKGTL